MSWRENAAIKLLLPVARAVKWSLLPGWAQLRTLLPYPLLDGPAYFIVGCGRSGTTILGNVLGLRREVAYRNEPIHYWHAIDSRTDYTGFLTPDGGRCWLDSSECTRDSQLKMRRLFGQIQLGRTVVEKLPINALRMEWLRSLYDGSRFIHIIRDGRAVVKSIQFLAKHGSYRVAGKSLYNQWWGQRYCKWQRLAAEGIDHQIYPEALSAIGEASTTVHAETAAHAEMAAYEWLVSVTSARASAQKLELDASHYLEIRYEELLRNPTAVLRQIDDFMQLPPDRDYAKQACAVLRSPSRSVRYELELPTGLYEPFVQLQRTLDYPIDGVTERLRSGS